MKARVKWVEERTFLGRSGSNNSVVMDKDVESGGHGAGFRPMEMILLGMGGCTGYDVVDILEKMREPIDDCVIELEAERADDHPKVFTRVVIRYIVSGRGLNPKKVERAVNLSAEKYCPATIMIGKTAEIVHEIEIVDPEPARD